MNESNIQLIIEGCRAERQAAQKSLFELRYGYVMSICMQYARNHSEAQEMLNDTFYNVFRFIDRYDDAYPFKPWLRKVCVNCCLMYQRKYFKKDQKVPLDDKYLNLQFEDIDIPDSEDLDYMKLLSKLPPASKTVLILYVIEGYKHQEIAEKLGISVGTSKSNLFRAKKLLYEMLEKDKKGKLNLKDKYRE